MTLDQIIHSLTNSETMKTSLAILLTLALSINGLRITVGNRYQFDSDYMRRAVESAQEAFKMYDNEPEDMQLTYQELQKVENLAVTEEMFQNTWDMNKDGHLTVAELSTVIYGLELLPAAVEIVPQNEGSFVTQKPT